MAIDPFKEVNTDKFETESAKIVQKRKKITLKRQKILHFKKI